LENLSLADCNDAFASGGIADLPAEWRVESETNPAKSSDWKRPAQQAMLALQRGDERIMDTLTTQFERTLIMQALQHTNGAVLKPPRCSESAQYFDPQDTGTGLDNQGE